ncbi:MAG: DNRLRE domain-containing protein, partial [Tepidisphaeraceae bacterium]
SWSGITLDWADNAESDLAGYNIYRATSAGGTYVLVNTGGLLSGSNFIDTNAPAGASFYRVTAVNGSAMESAVSATVNAVRQKPFNGNPFAIGNTPITIQAEDFDLGGQGIAYNDTSANNIGGAYRPSEAVDIKPIAGASGQYRISDAITGEWLEYTTNVSASGTYLMEFRVGNRDPGSTFHVEINGVNVTGTMTVPDTDSFDVFTTISKTLNLTAGENVLRFVFDSPASSGYGAAFDWIKVTQQVAAPEAPAGLTASGSTNGIHLDWVNNTESDLAGYYVYRSSTAGGTYTKISGASPLLSSSFLDTTAPSGQVSHYRVTAVNAATIESAPASVNALRPSGDTTAPGVPQNLLATGSVANIALDWTNNADSDLAGYNVYYSETLNGTYAKLNGANFVTSSSYVDASVAPGATRYYKITAVDTNGNESAQSAPASATRSGSSSTLTLGAAEDATVRGGTNGTINYGAATSLEVKEADADRDRRAYMKFDLTGVTSVTSAVVRLFGYLADGTSPSAVSLNGVASDAWSEGSITFNNSPAVGAVLATQTITGANPGAAAWYEFDVTAYLQAAIAAGKTQVTIAITTAAGTRVSFNSAEAASNTPAMVITT